MDNRLRELLEVGGVILSSERLEDVLARVNSRVRELLEAERFLIWQVLGEPGVGGRPAELSTRVEARGGIDEVRIPAAETTFVGVAARSGEVILASSAEELTQRYPNLRLASTGVEAPGIERLAVVPIQAGGKVAAVIEVVNSPLDLDPSKPLMSKLGQFVVVSCEPETETGVFGGERERRSLEQIMVEEGMVSSTLMADAMEQAGESKRPVHKVLNSLHHLPERDYARAVAIRYGKTFFEWTDAASIDVEALRRAVPERAARLADLVPLKLTRVGGRPGLRVVVTAMRYMKGDLTLDIDLPVHEVLIGAKSDVAKLMATVYLAGAAPGRDQRKGMGTILRAIEKRREEGDVRAIEVKRGAKEEDGPIVNLVHRIVEDAWRDGASDVHIEPREQVVLVRFRKDGELRKVLTFPIHARRAVVTRIKILAGMDITVRNRPQDGKISYRELKPGALTLSTPGLASVELRVGTLPTVGDGREDVVMRLLPNAKPTPLEDLRMRPFVFHNVKELVAAPHGLFLVVGPTGSGKTTTLHACLHHINRPELKIVTVEDPVEITHPDFRQVQVNRKQGLGFPEALRQFLRQDPDVMMVGECRDEETAHITMEAALTGHLVLSTLHTNSAPETVSRLLDMNVEPFTFADALLGVLAQRLVRTLCDQCKEPWVPEPEDWKEMRVEPIEEPLFRPVGCEACGGGGYRGRMGVHELMVNNRTIGALIGRRAPVAEILEAAKETGMATLFEDGVTKALQGVTTVGEVRRVCSQRSSVL